MTIPDMRAIDGGEFFIHPRRMASGTMILSGHDCKLTFSKKMMDELGDEDVLANEELESITRTLNDYGDDLSRL